MFFGEEMPENWIGRQAIMKGADREHEYRGTDRGVTSKARKVMAMNTGKNHQHICNKETHQCAAGTLPI